MKDNFFLKVDVKTILREDAGDFIFEGLATTSNPDREHDILEHKGAFWHSEEIPLLMHHAQNLPVGVVRLFQAEEGIRYIARIANPAGDDTDFGQRRKSAIAQIKSGVIRGVSIGYLAQPGSVKRLTPVGRRISRFEVVELSLVSVPANRDATIREIKSIFKGNGPQAAKEKKTLNLAQMIADRKTSIETKNARILEIVGEVETSGSTFTESQTEEFETLGAEVKSIEADVARLEMALEIDKKSAKPVKTDPGTSHARAPVQVKTVQTGEKGTGFARFAMVVAAGKGNLMQSEKLAETYFPNDAELNTSIKAAVAAGTTTDATWAAPLVDSYQRFAGDFVEFLRPQTIIGKFGTGNIPSLRRVPFNIEIPGQITGGEGYWVGEGAPKPLTKFDFENITLRWNKVANIAVLTQELIRFSDPAAEVLVRDALAAALLARLDQDFIDPTKAANGEISPASITNGVTPITSAGRDVDAVNADIAAVMGAFITANNTPQTGVWIMSSVRALALSLMKEPLGNRAFPEVNMNGGTFAGLPVIVSQYVPNDIVILVNAGDVFLADDGGVSIDSSRETSLQMDNAPTNNSGVPTATQMVSMFQTNSVALRAERYITWKRRRPSGVQVLTDVAWGSPA